MKKLPVCKNCGKVGHFQYQCWSKMRSKPPKSRSKALVRSKTYSIPSRGKKAQYNRQKLIKELDKYYSLYVRLRAADEKGLCRCYICGRTDLWTNMDNNHYISRRFQLTRWDLANMVCGCRVCNRIKNGNYAVFEPKLKKDLGVDNVQKLWDKAYSGRKIPTYELARMLSEIKQKYKTLIEERKNKDWAV